MVSWARFESEAPELAAGRVQRIFEAHKHKVLGTLRGDGSPRLSGIEVTIALGELWLGMMPRSQKVHDLRRDPRFAVHNAPLDLELSEGDAKVAGRVVEERHPARLAAFWKHLGHPSVETDAVVFRAELEEASVVRVEGDELVIESWRAGEPPRTDRRR